MVLFLWQSLDTDYGLSLDLVPRKFVPFQTAGKPNHGQLRQLQTAVASIPPYDSRFLYAEYGF